jgi:hypothetical protein
MVERAADPVSVRHDANAPADCSNEKDLQCGPFVKRLKGFEPSTFCMASRTRGDADGPDVPANPRIFLRRANRDDPRISPRDHGGLRTESGLSGVPGGSTAAAEFGGRCYAATLPLSSLTTAPPLLVCECGSELLRRPHSELVHSRRLGVTSETAPFRAKR